MFRMNILSLAVYLLQSYAIYRLAVVRGLPNLIFAFIPFFQLFMLGQIGDSLRYRSYQMENFLKNVPLAYALPLISIAGSILRYPLSLMAALLVSIGTVIIYYLVFLQYAPKNYLLFTIIVCLPVLLSVLEILSLLPMVGGIFGLASGILSIAAGIAPIAGPLLILWSIKGYRKYR